MAYLWTKSIHLLFVMAWVAGVFYLPRTLVNLAESSEAGEPEAVRTRLLLMGRRLYKFGHMMFGFAFLAGLLQNVGLIVSLRIMDQAAQGEAGLGSDVFLARLARDTRRLCASIAREWKFPDTVAEALLEQGELRRGATVSPLGRLLRMTDYLGKVRMLVEQGLLDEADATLFTGLPPEAAACYAALAANRDG